jgi:hypothetical protein
MSPRCLRSRRNGLELDTAAEGFIAAPALPEYDDLCESDFWTPNSVAVFSLRA